MGISRVAIGAINLLTKSPRPSKYTPTGTSFLARLQLATVLPFRKDAGHA